MFCPVCNGMEPLQAYCAECSRPADDLGRLSDLNGPYSPYESITIIEQNAWPDGEPGLCKHLCSCSCCGSTFISSVAERKQ